MHSAKYDCNATVPFSIHKLVVCQLAHFFVHSRGVEVDLQAALEKIENRSVFVAEKEGGDGNPLPAESARFGD